MVTGSGLALAVWTLMSALLFQPACANTLGERSVPQEELNDLRDLITAGISAAREGDRPKLEEIARNLMIPDYETWFTATFGEEQGTRLTAAYRTNFERDEHWMPKLFEWLSKQQGELEVQDASQLPRNMANSCGKALMDSEKSNTAFYRVDLRRKDNSGLSTGSSAGYFVLVQGAFRRLDCKSLGLKATTSGVGEVGGSSEQAILTEDRHATPPMRVRIGENDQKAKLIEKVQPKYPEEALKNRIAGTVALHVILEKDGTVKQVEVLSGHPLLSQAAVDAVRQWKYRPTLLNAEPVEVDTRVDVIFALSTAPKTP